MRIRRAAYACNDMWFHGYGKIAVVPTVNLEYSVDRGRKIKEDKGICVRTCLETGLGGRPNRLEGAAPSNGQVHSGVGQSDLAAVERNVEKFIGLHRVKDPVPRWRSGRQIGASFWAHLKTRSIEQVTVCDGLAIKLSLEEVARSIKLRKCV